MADFDAFRSRLGVGQGRVPAQAPSPVDDHVFVLGDEEPGRVFELVPGDHAQIEQSVDLTGVDFVRVRMRLRVPESLPSGLAWEVSLLVAGQPVARVRGQPGRTRALNDVVAPVFALSGVHDFAVRLALVETSSQLSAVSSQ